MRIGHRLDWRAATLFVRADPQWKRKILRGGWLLFFTPLGWPVALGYRKSLIERLATRAEPLLPSWDEGLLRFWISGMRALGVIFAHYLPLFVLVAVEAGSHGLPELPWLWIAAVAFFLFPLTPFLGPFLIIASSAWVGSGAFTRIETVAALGYFGLATFLIPAGFLQVSRTGRYRSAFRITSNVRFVVRHFGLYVEAWIYSGLASLVGHLCVPLTPWGVFWCYQSIVYSFNEVRLHTGDPEDRAFAQGPNWFQEQPAGAAQRAA